MSLPPRMLAPARRACYRCTTTAPPTSALSSVGHLLPLQQRANQPPSPSPSPHRLGAPTRSFSTTPAHLSKIGRAPLSIPQGVSFEVSEPGPSSLLAGGGRLARAQPMLKVEVKGPLGEMAMDVPSYISIDRSNPAAPTLDVMDAEDAKQRQMWGTVRAYLNNHILGVSEGHVAILRLVGVGYRATIENSATTKAPEYPGQQFVNLKVGYSHPIELGIPKGVKASTPQPTRILLEGIEKEVVMQFAADIKWWRRPEPYKGKGIFVNGETIKIKSKRMK